MIKITIISEAAINAAQQKKHPDEIHLINMDLIETAQHDITDPADLARSEWTLTNLESQVLNK